MQNESKTLFISVLHPAELKAIMKAQHPQKYFFAVLLVTNAENSMQDKALLSI